MTGREDTRQSRVSRFIGSRPPRSAQPVSTAAYKFLAGLVETETELAGASGHAEATETSENTESVESAEHAESVETARSLGVVFAVSGGADSLALTVAGADVASRLGIPYQALIVDHQMRPDSGVEAERVASQLREVGVGGVNVLVPKKGANEDETVKPSGVGLEEAARDLRHRALQNQAQKWAGRQGLKRVIILFGHTAEDQAETVLMRLGRGASPAALAGMRAVSEEIISKTSDLFGVTLLRGRPLLGLRRADTEAFCSVLGLQWEEDPTNKPDGPWRRADGTALPRAALRHETLPSLSRALGQDAVSGLTRLAELAAGDDEALEHYARMAYDDSVKVVATGADDFSTGAGDGWISVDAGPTGAHDFPEGVGEVVEVNVARLATHPRAVRTRVLRLAWTHLPPCNGNGKGRPRGRPRQPRDLTMTQVMTLDELVMTPISSARHPVGKTVHLPGFGRAKRERDHLTMWVKCRH